MATLSKKFKKSNKSKSSSRSRKHFNKSRKNGLKTKKMMRGGAGWFKKKFGKSKPVMKPPVMKSPVMAQPVTEQPIVETTVMPKKNWVSPWNTPEYTNTAKKRLALYGPEKSLEELRAERLALYGPEKSLEELRAEKIKADAERAKQNRDALLQTLAEGADNPRYR